MTRSTSLPSSLLPSLLCLPSPRLRCHILPFYPHSFQILLRSSGLFEILSRFFVILKSSEDRLSFSSDTPKRCLSGSFRIFGHLWGCFEMPPTSVTWWSDPSPPTILSRGGLHFRLQELLSDSLGSINIAAAFFYYEGDPLLPFLEILSRCFNTPQPPPQILHVSIARIPPTPPPPQSCILYNIMVY